MKSHEVVGMAGAVVGMVTYGETETVMQRVAVTISYLKVKHLHAERLA